jgi:ankyrin repeat protein
MDQINYKLLYACRHGHFDTVKYLVEQGANVNAVDNHNNSPGEHGTTALMYASVNPAYIGLLGVANADTRFNIVKYLVEHGADVNAKNAKGRTALMWASTNRRLEIVKYLVEHGADVNPKDYEGSTALLNAASGRRFNIVKYLVEHGADVNARPEFGYTALIYASEKGRLDIVKYLIEHGADVNAKDDDGNTALLIAAKYCDRLDVIKYLVEHGADINAKDRYKDSVLLIAAQDCISRGVRLDIVKYLIKHGADVNTKDKYGKTVLMYAYSCGMTNSVKIVKCLVKHGADIDNKCVLYLLKHISLQKKILPANILRQLLLNNKLNSVQKTTLKSMLPPCSLWNDTIEGYSKKSQKCGCYFHTESILNLVIASKK